MLIIIKYVDNQKNRWNILKITPFVLSCHSAFWQFLVHSAGGEGEYSWPWQWACAGWWELLRDWDWWDGKGWLGIRSHAGRQQHIGGAAGCRWPWGHWHVCLARVGGVRQWWVWWRGWVFGGLAVVVRGKSCITFDHCVMCLFHGSSGNGSSFIFWKLFWVWGLNFRFEFSLYLNLIPKPQAQNWVWTRFGRFRNQTMASLCPGHQIKLKIHSCVSLDHVVPSLSPALLHLNTPPTHFQISPDVICQTRALVVWFLCPCVLI